MPIPPPPPIVRDPSACLGRVAMVARWRPLHLGQVAVLDSLVARSETLQIGLGSCNRYDLRNPFTGMETRDQLALHLPPSVAVLDVPDLGDGPRWAAMVADIFGPLDLFVAPNPWVWSLMVDHYPLCHPLHLVPEHRRVPIEGTMVRLAMAKNEDWQALVSPQVAGYIEGHRLDQRFRAHFGAETLAAETLAAETLAAETPTRSD